MSILNVFSQESFQKHVGSYDMPNKEVGLSDPSTKTYKRQYELIFRIVYEKIKENLRYLICESGHTYKLSMCYGGVCCKKGKWCRFAHSEATRAAVQKAIEVRIDNRKLGEEKEIALFKEEVLPLNAQVRKEKIPPLCLPPPQLPSEFIYEIAKWQDDKDLQRILATSIQSVLSEEEPFSESSSSSSPNSDSSDSDTSLSCHKVLAWNSRVKS